MVRVMAGFAGSRNHASDETCRAYGGCRVGAPRPSAVGNFNSKISNGGIKPGGESVKSFNGPSEFGNEADRSSRTAADLV
jgi:hypothetical protein